MNWEIGINSGERKEEGEGKERKNSGKKGVETEEWKIRVGRSLYSKVKFRIVNPGRCN